jgi:hypothetical protein
MKLLTRFVVLAGISGLAACATEGPATSTGTGAGQSAPATSSAASTSQSAPASAAAASAPAKFVTPSGYKHVQVNGEDRYCRKEVATGTRAQTTEICLTQDQLSAEKDSSRDLIEGVQHNQGTAIYSQPNGAY